MAITIPSAYVVEVTFAMHGCFIEMTDKDNCDD